MAYTILLLVLAIIQHTRGNYVWTQCVHEVNFSAPRAGGVMQPGMVTQPQMHTPQPGTPFATPAPSYNTSPERQMPMNTGYAQPPVNTGYIHPGYAQV